MDKTKMAGIVNTQYGINNNQTTRVKKPVCPPFKVTLSHIVKINEHLIFANRPNIIAILFLYYCIYNLST